MGAIGSELTMSNELLPCPFCGGTQDEDGAIDHGESCFVYQLIDMFMYGSGSKNIIEKAWNTREPMRNIEAYARIAVQEAERTCRMEMLPPDETRMRWLCSECSGVHLGEASHFVRPNYCPSCGAKVVE